MSYSRRFSRTITIPYKTTVTLTYPASKTGGTKTETFHGEVQEEVVVDVEVDTTPFDSSVAGCNSQVNGLTASVGAMNTAQCISISKNADKVSKTIIDGFFHTIRTDIGTQKMELEQTIESKLLLLRQQAESLANIRHNMTEDYNRTSARYQKIFEDLNNELSIRIHEIDQPVFKLTQCVDEQNDRMIHTDMVQSVAAFGKESSMLQSQIEAATVKRHALQAMNQVKQFLMSKAETESTLRQSRVEGDGDNPYLIPVCYMRTENENNRVDQLCAIPEQYAAQDPKLEGVLCDTLMDTSFEDASESEREQVQSYFQTEINNQITGSDPHSERVKAMITNLFNRKK